MEARKKNIAIVCQGGGSHAAYAAGALQSLLQALEKQPEELRLTGLSGTSGGAICAMLAWYGMLKGGHASAKPMLDKFWHSNCAILPGERIWNDSAIRAMSALPCEILFSPYQWPTSASLSVFTDLWPAWSTWMEPFTWPALKWMRGEFFQLGELIKPHVRFELISALGSYCSIPFDIERWKMADLEERMYGGGGPAAERKAQLEARIRASLARRTEIERLMAAERFRDDTPLREALQGGPDAPQVFDVDTLNKLAEKVEPVMAHIPHLLLGAVDVGNGEFTAFSSERATDENGISLQAVLASAALPWLFKAVEIEKKTLAGKLEKQQFWDGLFSQNPPIKNFISGKDKQSKPDEVWVVQINPIECDLDMLKNDIWDRRNELSGNLSLNQEVDFIRAINKRIDAASAAGKSHPPGDGADKHLHVHRIVMHSALIEKKIKAPLGSLSKADRSIELKEILMADGKQQGDDFLLLRAAMLEACDNLDSAIYRLASPDSEKALGSQKALAALRALTALPRTTTAASAAVAGAAATSAAATDKVRLIIDETSMPPISRKGGDPNAEPYQSLVRWHTRGVLQGGIHVNVEGETEFQLKGENGNRVALARAIRISCVEQVSERERAQALLAAAGSVQPELANLANLAGRPAAKGEHRPD